MTNMTNKELSIWHEAINVAMWRSEDKDDWDAYSFFCDWAYYLWANINGNPYSDFIE